MMRWIIILLALLLSSNAFAKQVHVENLEDSISMIRNYIDTNTDYIGVLSFGKTAPTNAFDNVHYTVVVLINTLHTLQKGKLVSTIDHELNSIYATIYVDAAMIPMEEFRSLVKEYAMSSTYQLESRGQSKSFSNDAGEQCILVSTMHHNPGWIVGAYDITFFGDDHDAVNNRNVKCDNIVSSLPSIMPISKKSLFLYSLF